jgi:hypothetical protein
MHKNVILEGLEGKSVKKKGNKTGYVTQYEVDVYI